MTLAKPSTMKLAGNLHGGQVGALGVAAGSRARCMTPDAVRNGVR